MYLHLHVHAFDVKKAWGKEEANENTEATLVILRVNDDANLDIQYLIKMIGRRDVRTASA